MKENYTEKEYYEKFQISPFNVFNEKKYKKNVEELDKIYDEILKSEKECDSLEAYKLYKDNYMDINLETMEYNENKNVLEFSFTMDKTKIDDNFVLKFGSTLLDTMMNLHSRMQLKSVRSEIVKKFKEGKVPSIYKMKFANYVDIVPSGRVKKVHVTGNYGCIYFIVGTKLKDLVESEGSDSKYYLTDKEDIEGLDFIIESEIKDVKSKKYYIDGSGTYVLRYETKEKDYCVPYITRLNMELVEEYIELKTKMPAINELMSILFNLDLENIDKLVEYAKILSDHKKLKEKNENIINEIRKDLCSEIKDHFDIIGSYTMKNILEKRGKENENIKKYISDYIADYEDLIETENVKICDKLKGYKDAHYYLFRKQEQEKGNKNEEKTIDNMMRNRILELVYDCME